MREVLCKSIIGLTIELPVPIVNFKLTDLLPGNLSTKFASAFTSDAIILGLSSQLLSFKVTFSKPLSTQGISIPSILWPVTVLISPVIVVEGTDNVWIAGFTNSYWIFWDAWILLPPVDLVSFKYSLGNDVPTALLVLLSLNVVAISSDKL